MRGASGYAYQGLPEFAGIQIQSEQGKPLMAITQCLGKLRIPTARGNVPVRHEGRELWGKRLQPLKQRRPKRLADWAGEVRKMRSFGVLGMHQDSSFPIPTVTSPERFDPIHIHADQLVCR